VPPLVGVHALQRWKAEAICRPRTARAIGTIPVRTSARYAANRLATTTCKEENWPGANRPVNPARTSNGSVPKYVVAGVPPWTPTGIRATARDTECPRRRRVS
jgi:hypothetical protein